MRIVHSSKPLALAASVRAFALTRVIFSPSQADPVLFLITKPIQEPRIQTNHKRRGLVPFYVSSNDSLPNSLFRYVDEEKAHSLLAYLSKYDRRHKIRSAELFSLIEKRL